MKTTRIAPGTYPIGWRHQLPELARQGIDSFLPREAYMEAFSKAREVELGGFEMQVEPVAVEALMGAIDDYVLEEICDVGGLCDRLDEVLASSGWRLPTEDEFEAAVGGGLFAWGHTLPAGSPYQPGDFELHQAPTSRGLMLPHNSYQVELVRAALKMGDGGSAVCGGYPWPVAWLTLSPSARVPESMLDDVFIWTEDATVHPVRSLSRG